MNHSNHSGKPPERMKSLTSLTLGWLAEKVRKTEEIKSKLASGNYRVESEKVAAAILGSDTQHN
ncbi:MAG: flagellar biosynthesis anti-sigma factor FlgM [Candidatus Dadabacteria bacterium]|nr:MAG: flagellar biosynthesis anti-sigma factor FlgM [Candidatus Dadabacteria bacterium]